MNSTIKHVLRVEFEEKTDFFGRRFIYVEMYVNDCLAKKYSSSELRMGQFERSAYHFIINNRSQSIEKKETVKKGFLNRFLRFFKNK